MAWGLRNPLGQVEGIFRKKWKESFCDQPQPPSTTRDKNFIPFAVRNARLSEFSRIPRCSGFRGLGFRVFGHVGLARLPWEEAIRQASFSQRTRPCPLLTDRLQRLRRNPGRLGVLGVLVGRSSKESCCCRVQSRRVQLVIGGPRKTVSVEASGFVVQILKSFNCIGLQGARP